MDRSSILRASTKDAKRPTATKSQVRALFCCLFYWDKRRFTHLSRLPSLEHGRRLALGMVDFLFFKANSKETMPGCESMVKDNGLGEDPA